MWKLAFLVAYCWLRRPGCVFETALWHLGCCSIVRLCLASKTNCVACCGLGVKLNYLFLHLRRVVFSWLLFKRLLLPCRAGHLQRWNSHRCRALRKHLVDEQTIFIESAELIPAAFWSRGM